MVVVVAVTCVVVVVVDVKVKPSAEVSGGAQAAGAKGVTKGAASSNGLQCCEVGVRSRCAAVSVGIAREALCSLRGGAEASAADPSSLYIAAYAPTFSHVQRLSLLNTMCQGLSPACEQCIGDEKCGQQREATRLNTQIQQCLKI